MQQYEGCCLYVICALVGVYVHRKQARCSFAEFGSEGLKKHVHRKDVIDNALIRSLAQQ